MKTTKKTSNKKARTSKARTTKKTPEVLAVPKIGKATKKTPRKSIVPAAPPAPKRKGASVGRTSVGRTRKDGTPAKSTGIKGPRPIGVKSGVGVERTWAEIFERETGRKKGHLNDAGIEKEMRANFPGRDDVDVYGRIGTVRAKYNRGGFPFQGGPPAKKASKVG